MSELYARFGVDIGAARKATQGLAKWLSGIGHFGGLFPKCPGEDLPSWVIISVPRGISEEFLRNGHSVQLTSFLRRELERKLTEFGFNPAFAVDYIGVNKLDPAVFEGIGQSFFQMRNQVGLKIVGGEIAETPDIYQDGAGDLLFWVAAKKIGTPSPDLNSAKYFHVVSIDSTGTKSVLALETGHLQGLPFDLVNHGINDVMCTGADPKSFYAYLGMHSSVNPEVENILREGLVEACRSQNLTFMGCVTEVKDDIYREGQIDFVGVATGEVERSNILSGKSIGEGDILIGLSSSGFHTSGYSLVRKLTEDVPNRAFLLRPHRSYREEISKVRGLVTAIAHITGGGLFDNIERLLPRRLEVEIRAQNSRGRWLWSRPAEFELIDYLLGESERGFYKPDNEGRIEAFRVFNQGIGLAFVVSSENVRRVRRLLPKSYKMGRCVRLEEY